MTQAVAVEAQVDEKVGAQIGVSALEKARLLDEVDERIQSATTQALARTREQAMGILTEVQGLASKIAASSKAVLAVNVNNTKR